MSRPGKLRREVERELVAGLRARRRRALIERLRGNASERRGWDRMIAAVRVLEDRPVSGFEIDQVERWLFEDLAEDRELAVAPSGRARKWTWLGATVATLATAAALALWIADDQAGPSDDPGRFNARGRSLARPLALEPVCGTPVRPARDRGCALDELLGFSVRLGDEALTSEQRAALSLAPMHLSLFGIAEDGEVRYYLPTPDDPVLPTLALESRWQPLPLGIRLGVNHGPGRVRVFALVSDEQPRVADIDRLAAALRPQPPADVDTPPWHLRLDRSALRDLCRDLDRCASAESEFWIPDLPKDAP